MGRKRPRLTNTPSTFSYYVDDADEDADEEVSYQHTTYRISASGLRRTTNTIQLPCLPSENHPRLEAVDDSVVWNDVFNPQSEDTGLSEAIPDPGNFGDLDLAYIEDLAQLELDEPKKQNCTAAVSR